MPKLTKRQLVTGASVLYLTALTILAAYALHQSHYYSLPIPSVEAALTVALPPLAGVALSAIIAFQHELAAQRKLTNSKIFQSVNAAFLIYEAVLAALAGTHIAPWGGLRCPLQDKWRQMNSAKDGDRIRRIQDAFNCCGFAGTKDMAFPFPDKAHDSGRCVARYERTEACLEPWRGMERKIAIMLLVVPCSVFLWKFALFVAPGFDYDAPWLPSAVRLPRDSSDNHGTQPRRAIQYRDVEQSGEDDSLQDEVTALNKDSNLATHVERGRVHPSPLIQEHENNWAGLM